jgi:hypothetical protein
VFLIHCALSIAEVYSTPIDAISHQRRRWPIHLAHAAFRLELSECVRRHLETARRPQPIVEHEVTEPGHSALRIARLGDPPSRTRLAKKSRDAR